MAPKGMKRPATATESITNKCHKVATALTSHDHPQASKSVRHMLAGMTYNSLAIYKDERHPHQDKIVGMISEVLAGQKAALQQEIDTLQAKVANADHDKADRQQAVISKEALLKAAEEAVPGKISDLQQAKDADKEASKGAAEAEKAQKAGDAEYEASESNKKDLEGIVSGPYTTLKTPPEEGTSSAKKDLKACEDAGEKFAFDGSLMFALPKTLKREVGSRTPWDGVVLKAFEEACTSKIAELTKLIEEGAPAKAARAATVAEKLQVSEEAHAKVEAAKQALHDAHAATKAAEKELHAAQNSVKNHLSDLQETADSLDEKKLIIETFVTDVMKDFEELKVHEKPPPEPEVPEEPEVPDVPAAPAAAEGDAVAVAPTISQVISPQNAD